MKDNKYSSYALATIWMRKRGDGQGDEGQGDEGSISVHVNYSGGWDFYIFTGRQISSTVVVNYEQMLKFLKEVEDGQR